MGEKCAESRDFDPGCKMITCLINWLIKRTDFMSTLTEVQAEVTALTDTIVAIDTKLDEIRAFILSLSGGGVVTQEQLDALAASITSAKESAAAVLTETDSLDEA